MREIRDKLLVGLPTSKSSNILFYDPAFLHCTPIKELVSESQIIQDMKIDFSVRTRPFTYKKGKSLPLPQEEKEKILSNLDISRKILRFHYIPYATSIQLPYYQESGNLDATMHKSNRIIEEFMEGLLNRYIREINIEPHRMDIISNPTQLNNALKSLIVKNMTLGGKTKTQKRHKKIIEQNQKIIVM